MTFVVSRILSGKVYHKDEDRIIAGSWDAAEKALEDGKASGRFDHTCELVGILVQEGHINDNILNGDYGIN